MREQRSFEVAEHATDSSLHSSLRRRENLKTCLVQPRRVCAVIQQSSQSTRPSADCARNPKAEKKQKNPLVGVVCLLTNGGLIRVRPSHTREPQLGTPARLYSLSVSS